ncbi:hypothetical protein F383_30107 [Gossypium arboreum]|uniref:Uncharacterized protein n=1 Tax=Gossypium arboreum TaxID=29729 RepID=A0A0B0PGN2_GOSAR|nr:hypothetical protein F383_30107 [Gossypium arboreum]
MYDSWECVLEMITCVT